MEEITAEWLNIAEEDYKMARTAFRAKKYPHWYFASKPWKRALRPITTKRTGKLPHTNTT